MFRSGSWGPSQGWHVINLTNVLPPSLPLPSLALLAWHTPEHRGIESNRIESNRIESNQRWGLGAELRPKVVRRAGRRESWPILQGPDRPGFNFCPSSCMTQRSHFFNPLSLSFLNCKLGVHIVPTSLSGFGCLHVLRSIATQCAKSSA